MTTEQFHWTSPAGVEIVLPHANRIKGGVLRKYRKLEPVDFMFSILEDIGDDATIAKLDDLEIRDLEVLFNEWQQAAGGLGESSGSST